MLFLLPAGKQRLELGSYFNAIAEEGCLLYTMTLLYGPYPWYVYQQTENTTPTPTPVLHSVQIPCCVPSLVQPWVCILLEAEESIPRGCPAAACLTEEEGGKPDNNNCKIALL